MVGLLEFLDGDNLSGRSVTRLEDLPIGPKVVQNDANLTPLR
jgi:hypothetical protein